MPTVTLTPSTYYLSNSNYLSVSNASNMYADCDSTSYATITNSRTSTTSYYCYVRGFDLSSIPSDAIVSSFAVRVKARHSGGYAQAMYLYDGTSTSLGSSSTTLSTTATTHTINTTHSWADLVAAGSDLGIRINCRRSSRNTTAYVYIYGAEIEVTYTVPVYHDVTITNGTSATVTASDTHPLEGTDVEIMSDTMSGIRVTDNGDDVTSQFVQKTQTTADYEIVNEGSYGFALSNGYYVSQNKGVDKSAAVCHVDFYLPVSGTVTFSYINYAEATYDFGVFGNVDVALSTSYYAAGSSGATITDSSYKKACNTSSDNSSSVQTLTYSNVSAGNHSIWVKFSKDDGSASGNDTLQFQVTITLSQSITYYGYTISNIQADHAIVVTASGGGPTLYVKLNGSWVQVQRAYKKQNGSWSQTALDEVFQAGVNYKQG